MKILFINSQNFWLNGWLNTPNYLEYAIDTLSQLQIDVHAKEVKNIQELRSVLDQVSTDTLVWANAYYVANENGQPVWMQDVIESYKLPYMGTNAAGLQTMLDKTKTHQALEKTNVPIPKHLHITRDNFDQLEELLEQKGLNYPIVIKPTSESCSMGILKVTSLAQTQKHITQLFEEFPHSDALLETFLASEDITCAYFQWGNEVLLLPTYYKSLKMPGKDYLMERDLGVPPWSGADILMPPVEDVAVLEQLQTQMPALVRAIGIGGITRADARLDAQGILRYFDINGMPALTFPKSVLVRQIRECFPSLSDLKAYQYLLSTLLIMTAERWNLPIPQPLLEQNLFSLKGKYSLRLSLSKSVGN